MIIGYDSYGEELKKGDKVKVLWMECCYSGEEEGVIDYNDFSYRVNDIRLSSAVEIKKIK